MRIKKVVFGLIILICGILFLKAASAQTVDTEKILSFDSIIKINQDASMTVTENIRVRCLLHEIKRGIYRDFPTRYKDNYGNNYVVDFDVSEVLKDGQPEKYHFEELSNGRRVYIGKRDVYLEAGDYTYTIVYKTNRQLGFFKEFDELYWNVTGNGWIFPIERASATVELPLGAVEKIISSDAYTGPLGSRWKNFTVSTDNLGRVVFATTKPLEPRQGLTIIVSWAKGYVVEPTLETKTGYFIRDNRGLAVGIIGFLALIIYYLFVWSRFGRDPEKGIIIPLYNPPDNISPAAARFIMKMGYDNKVFASAVINMAVKKYLTIDQQGSKYTLNRTGAPDSVLTAEEMAISRYLFYKDDKISLKSENYEYVGHALNNFKSSLSKIYEKVYFLTNARYFVIGLALSFFTVIVSGAFESAEKLPIALFMCVWLTIWTFGVTFLLREVIFLWINASRQRALSARTATFGGAIFLSLFAIPFLIGEAFGIGILIFSTSVVMLPVLIAIVFVNTLFYHLLKAPTVSGRRMMDRLEGFKTYLGVAEKERLNVLNPPEKTPELFERYLPYALALDVEQQWSEKFADVLNKAGQDGKTYTPSWYSGTAWASLGAANFASGLSGSLSSAISSSSHAPGSSSGGGGGGSSGGGGGGGGGGGW